MDKILGKIDTKCLKSVKNIFWWKIRPTLGPRISGTKCDKDKPILSAERGGQSDCVNCTFMNCSTEAKSVWAKIILAPK